MTPCLCPLIVIVIFIVLVLTLVLVLVVVASDAGVLSTSSEGQLCNASSCAKTP